MSINSRRKNKRPKRVYEIWVDIDDQESSLLEADTPGHDSLTTDVQGRQMILKKIFKAGSAKYARKVYRDWQEQKFDEEWTKDGRPTD